MATVFYLLKLGPSSGCSPSPWNSINSCLSSLVSSWQRLPKDVRPVLKWAAEGEMLLSAPAQFPPTERQLWHLALLVKYPHPALMSEVGVDVLGQFADLFQLEVENAELQHPIASSIQTGKVESQSESSIPSQSPVPGYNRIKRMYEQNAKPGVPVVGVNLLSFKPDGGLEHYKRYLKSAALSLGTVGATVAYEANTTGTSGTSWDSLVIGMYPDKIALVRGVAHPEYVKAFKIRDEALRDALLLIATPIDITALNAVAHAKL